MWHFLRKHIKLLISWGLIVAVCVGVISLLLPTYYSAVTQVLIISRDRSGADPYTQAKAASQIGTNLAQVMQTSDFMNKVLASTDVPFDTSRWNMLTERQKRKEWQKDVKVDVVYDTSLIAVTAFAESQDDAVHFANAIATTLTRHGSDYVGGDVTLKQVDSPLVSRLPARPNLIFNALIGFVVGVLLCSIWLVSYRRHTLFGY